MKIRLEGHKLKIKTLCFVFLLLCLSSPFCVVASEGSLSGRVVIVDAGHGIGSPGGVLLQYGYFEHQRMFVLANYLRDELKSRGATVHMTRACHMNVPLPVRPAMMNRWSIETLLSDRLSRLKKGNPSIRERIELVEEINRLEASLDLLNKVIYNHRQYAPIYLNYPFDYTLQTRIHPLWQQILEFQSDPIIRYNWLAISLHSNGTSSPMASGADVFFSANNNPRNRRYFANYSHQDITELFGKMLLDAIAQLGIRANRARMHHFMVIRETNIPAVLTENGYHTNAQDRRLLMDDNFMQRLAISYAQTIEAYFAQINYDRHQNYEYAPNISEAFAWLTHSRAVWLHSRILMRAPTNINTTYVCNWYWFSYTSE